MMQEASLDFSTKMLMGTGFLQNNFLDEAKSYFKDIIQENSADFALKAEAKIKLARVHFSKRNFAKAAAILGQLLDEFQKIKEQDLTIEEKFTQFYLVQIEYLIALVASNQVDVAKKIVDEVKVPANDVIASIYLEAVKSFLIQTDHLELIRVLSGLVAQLNYITMFSSLEQQPDNNNLPKISNTPENILSQNDFFFKLGILLSTRSCFGEAKTYFELLRPISVDSYENKLVIKADYTKSKHYQYFLQNACNAFIACNYYDCIELALAGLSAYPQHRELIELTNESFKRLISFALQERSEEAFKQLSLLANHHAFNFLQKNLPEVQYQLCFSLTEYLEKNGCLYQAKQWLDKLLKSSEPDLLGLRYEKLGDQALFWGNIEEALHYYLRSINTNSNQNQISRVQKAYIASLILHEKDNEIVKIKACLQKKLDEASQHAKEKLEMDDEDQDKQHGAAIYFFVLLATAYKPIEPNQKEDLKKFEDFNHAINRKDAYPGEKNKKLRLQWLEAQAVILFYKREYKEALIFFQNLKSQYAEVTESYFKHALYEARIYFALNQHGKAEEILKDLVKKKPELEVDIYVIKLIYQRSLSATMVSKLYFEGKRLRAKASGYQIFDALYEQIENDYLQIQIKDAAVKLLNLLAPSNENKNVPKILHHVKASIFNESNLDKKEASVIIQQKISESHLCRKLLLSKEFNVNSVDLNFLNLTQTFVNKTGLTPSLIESAVSSLEEQADKFHVDEEITEDSNQKVRSDLSNDLVYQKFSESQKNCYEFLYKNLTDAFELARVLSREPDVKLEHKTTNIIFEALEMGGMAGGLLPFIGKTSIAITTGIKLFKYAVNYVKDCSDKKAAARIANLVPEHCHIHIVSDAVAKAVCCMYAYQIERIKINGGIDVFAEFVTVLMLHYISSNKGQESNLIKQAAHHAKNFFKGLYRTALRSVNAAYSPNKELKEDVINEMLMGLFCDLPFNGKGTIVMQKDSLKNLEDPWYVESIVMRVGIITPEGDKYHHVDGDADKYGYRLATKEVAEKLGYELSESQVELDVRHNINSQR